jgi:hypothetical protein
MTLPAAWERLRSRDDDGNLSRIDLPWGSARSPPTTRITELLVLGNPARSMVGFEHMFGSS